MTKKSSDKIMVVEDEAVISLRLKKQLTMMGYEVIDMAHTGEEAIEKARSQQPDLILLDIMIPGKMDGIEVAEILKEELDIPAIFLTAYSDKKIIERAKKAEPYGYIVKPFQDRELKAAIEVALYKKEKERRLRESAIQLKRSHDELERRVEERTKDLNIKTKDLEELNVALKILLGIREENKAELEENIMSNVKTLVEPYLAKLKKVSSVLGQKTLINILESNLNEIISPFSRRLSSKHFKLSPSEIQVANLVRQGKTNKEIAEILQVASRTIAFHRENIRKKLGLTNQKTNLKTYLMSLD